MKGAPTCAVDDCPRTGVRDVHFDVWTPVGNKRITVAMCGTHSEEK